MKNVFEEIRQPICRLPFLYYWRNSVNKILIKYLKLASKQSNNVFGLEYNGIYKFLKKLKHSIDGKNCR